MHARARIIIPFAFLMLSCTMEEGTDAPAAPGAPVTITAEIPDTRTSLGAKEGTAWPNRWSEGDAISVNGVQSDPLGKEFDGASAADFSASGVQAPFRVGYPAGAFSNYSGSSATVRIAPEQNYVPGSYDPSAFIMTGAADGSKVALTPAVALFRLTVDCAPSVTIRSVKLSSSNVNIAVSGTFTTDFSTLKATGGYRNYVMVNSSEGIPGGEPITFVMAPCDFSFSGLNVEITLTNGRKLTRSAVPTKAYKAGTMYTCSINPAELTVAYYNILRPESRKEEAHSLTIPAVYKALGKAIMSTGADVIGFGELDSNSLPGGWADLAATAPQSGYEWSLDWPNDIERSGFWLTGYTYSASCYFSNGFAYNPAVLRLEECDYVWLQKEGTSYFTGMKSAYGNSGSPERTVIKARFTHILSGKEFWFFVTHLPTSSQGGGENMAVGVNTYTSEVAGSVPSILVGDMNSADSDKDGSNRGPITVLMQQWTDAYDSAAQAGNIGDCDVYCGTMSGSSDSYYYTWQVFTKNHPERRIDHIMTRGPLKATRYDTVRTTYNYGGKAWCPSDHLPVVANIVFN